MDLLGARVKPQEQALRSQTVVHAPFLACSSTVAHHRTVATWLTKSRPAISLVLFSLDPFSYSRKMPAGAPLTSQQKQACSSINSRTPPPCSFPPKQLAAHSMPSCSLHSISPSCLFSPQSNPGHMLPSPSLFYIPIARTSTCSVILLVLHPKTSGGKFPSREHHLCFFSEPAIQGGRASGATTATTEWWSRSP